MLRHCLAPSLREQLNALPKSLDATYERVLDEIHSTNQGRHAHRLLQCLTVAVRPLRVEELAEVLAFELDTAEGELPRFHPDWRWEDQEHAVLSACSSLIAIVNSDDSRVIQFSHFSVKEYLTSERLSTSSGDITGYHIALEPAHLILAQACLGALLNVDTCVNKEYNESGDEGGSLHRDEVMPLCEYAAQHWTSHAQVGNVSSCLKDAMETLFDPNKPYFDAWVQIKRPYRGDVKQRKMYFAARHGFYDLVQYLIDRNPEQVTHHRYKSLSPLVGALKSSKHVRVAELLLSHGAHVHIPGDPPLCHAVRFSDDGRVNAVQFLLKHGAHVNAEDERLMTPLHFAAQVGCPKVARILLEYGADIGLKNEDGMVPLHLVSDLGDKDEEERLVLARLLLVRSCADVNARDFNGATPLHYASDHGRPKIVQLLLYHGANVQAEDNQGRNPLHQMSSSVRDFVNPQDVLRVTELLLEQGVDVNVLDDDHETPLHIASSLGHLDITQLLLDHGARAEAENVHGQTPLHLVSQRDIFNENAKVMRLLLQLGVDVNKRDKHLATPLHFASFFGHIEITKALLDHGANVHAQNDNGQTPLHQVSLHSEYQEYGHNHFAKLMLEHGADVNAWDKDQETPLHSASFMSNLEVARVLLDHGANIHARNVHGQTPLHIVSQGILHYSEESESDLVELLLSRGADVNARDDGQATPFLLACFCLKPETAKELFQNGTDINAVNIHGQNAWHLISQNLSYNNRDWLRARLGEFLLRHGVATQGRDEDERTPLHLSCYYGQLEVAEMLLGHGAQVNAADNRGHTPLHQVTLGNYDYQSFGMDKRNLKEHPSKVLRLADRVLESGADVNAQNKDQDTPLHLASRLRLHAMARLLLKNGADVNAKNSEGKSPSQLATGRKGKAMRRLLTEHSEKQA
jgi:ankyrin repeat protein